MGKKNRQQKPVIWYSSVVCVCERVCCFFVSFIFATIWRCWMQTRPFPRLDPNYNYVSYVQQCINEWVCVCLCLCFSIFLFLPASARVQALDAQSAIFSIHSLQRFLMAAALFFQLYFQFYTRTNKLRILMRAHPVLVLGCICSHTHSLAPYACGVLKCEWMIGLSVLSA